MLRPVICRAKRGTICLYAVLFAALAAWATQVVAETNPADETSDRGAKAVPSARRLPANQCNHTDQLRRIGDPDWRPPTQHSCEQTKDDTEPASLSESRPATLISRLPAAPLPREPLRPTSTGVSYYHEQLASPIDRRVHEISTGWSKIDSFFKKTDVSGHVRVRQATDFERIDRPTRNRGRLRARLGLTHYWNSEVSAGIRFTTGDLKQFLDLEDRRGAPLSYQDTGDVFDKFVFNLDRLFIRYAPDHWPGFFVTGGKFRQTIKLNPIFADPVGDLIWDEAVHPEGIAAGCTHKNVFCMDEIYWTFGKSVVLELNNDDEASLFYSQVWLKKRFGRVQLEAGVAWYDWNNLNPDGNTRISFENNFGNQVIPVGPNPEDVVFASQFNIINPMVALTVGDDCEYPPVWPIQFVGELFHNTKSFDASRDSGFSIGAQYGPAVLRQERRRWDWKLYYTWQEVQQESVLTPVSQDDFQRATNFSGNWVGLDIYPWDKIELRFWVLSDKPILPIDARGNVDLVNGFTDSEWRFRMDVSAYF